MPKNTPHKILILGAGFAGLRAAQDLSEHCKGQADCSITLVDKIDVHLYTPDLYEIANAFNNEITDECLTTLKESVATHTQSLIDKKSVTFIQDTVTAIHPKQNKVTLSKEGDLQYDTLIVALGSKQNFYAIPGLQQFAYPVKTIKDALVINCHLDTFFHFLWKKNTKKKVTISIGGGGATGVEFAAEMTRYLDLLSTKYDYPRDKMTIQIIQAGSELVGAGPKVSKYTIQRLEQKGVKILLNHMIVKAEPDKIHVKTGSKSNPEEKTIESDVLIWTGGVMVNPIVKESLGDPDHYGAISVNKFLQSTKHPNIYAAGDNAFYKDPKTGKTAPMLAQTAWEQGQQAAQNIIRSLQNKPQKPYKIHTSPLIMPLGGKWGIVKIGRFVFKGRLGWIIRRLTDLQYAMSIMPFWRALKKWHHDTNLFTKND